MSNEPRERQPTETPERSMGARPAPEDFEDPRAVFADPIGYLRRLGLEAELVEKEVANWARAA